MTRSTDESSSTFMQTSRISDDVRSQRTAIETPQGEFASHTNGIPSALERTEIPLYFRQFQNAAVLKKLAHAGKGPLYQLIGKKAWYETADIIAWLASRKRSGPQRALDPEKAPPPPPLQAPATPRKKKRGRPSKATQWRHAQAQRTEP